jgi:tetratricopeptide (TPR) repeat protein
MARLFLSHSSANNAEAVAIRDWLASEGWNEVFLDVDPERGIAAGERWERALNEAALRCEAVLFLISRDWINSRWCLKEFNLARRLNKRLFGVLIEAIAVTDLPADLAGVWQIVDLASGRDHVLLRVTVPRTHEEAHVTFSKEGLTRLRSGLAKAGLEPRFFPWPPERDPERSPYRGLKPIEAEDAGIFFGRDAPIVEALDSMRGLRDGAAPRLLVILGASGAGKSSFLRAGLMPRLVRDDRNFLPLPVIRPEAAAMSGETGLLRAVETALAAAGLRQSRAEIRDAIQRGAEGLRPLLAQLVDRAFAATLAGENDGKRPAVVLAIDQAEELFLGEGAREGLELLELIADLTSEDRPAIVAMFTIRSDSYDRLETAKAFEGLRQQTLPLLPMPRGSYQTVIEGPAARLRDTSRAFTVEPQLTQRLLEDIEKGGGSDALPLLAFTLEQLYLDYGGSGAIKVADYERFGGIRGAIEAAVERALKAADYNEAIPRDRDARLALLRRGLIPWLAGIDPDSASPRRRVARLADIPHEAAPLVGLLVEQRLLTTDRIKVREGDQEKSEITIEPAHEALLRQWGLLRGWLEEDFAALTTLEGVKRAARDWDANGRRAEWLNHSGTRLEDAQSLAARDDLTGDLSSIGRDYLSCCAEREEREQRERRERLERERAEQERQLRDAQSLAAANRRTAQRTGIGLVAALVLAVLAGWQWWLVQQAAQQTKQQRDRAEHALTLATDTANSLIFNLAQKFRNAAGVPAALVKEMLDQARALQDQLIGAGEANAQLRRSQSVALTESARTLLTLGDTEGAFTALKQAQSINQSLLVNEPNNALWLRDLSIDHYQLGRVLFAQGKLDDALAAYRQSVAISKMLLAKDENHIPALIDQGYADLMIGDALMAQGRSGDALSAYEESLATRRVLITKDASNERKNDLAASHERIGDVLKAQGRLDDALAAYREELAIDKILVESDRQSTWFLRDLGVAHFRIGDVLLAQGKLGEALAAFRESHAIRTALAAKDMSNTLWQFDRSFSAVRVGEVLKAQGKLEEAIAVFRDSLAIRQALVEKDANNTDWRREIAASDERIAGVLKAQGKLDDALAVYHEGFGILADLVAMDPGNTGWQRDLSISHENIGYVLFAQGKLDEALAAFRESLAIRKALVGKDATNTVWQFDLSFSLVRVGDVLAGQHKLDEAAVAFHDSLAIRRALVEKDANNGNLRRELAASHERIAGVLKAQGNNEEALAIYREGFSILAALVATDPGNTGWQRDFGISHENIGSVLFAQGKLDEALAAYGNALTIRGSLVARNRANTEWQNDLSLSYISTGDALKAQGKLKEALAAYRNSLAIAKILAVHDPTNAWFRNNLEVDLNRIGALAYQLVLAREFATALAAGDLCIPLAPEKLWLQTDRAHALMFLGRDDEARALYLQFRGRKNVWRDKSWERVVVEDFAGIRKAGLAHPLMDEIEKQLAPPK